MSESKLDIEGILANARASANKRTYVRVSHLRRQETKNSPEKELVNLDVPTDDSDLDEAYKQVILNNDKKYFADYLDVFDFLNKIVDRIYRLARVKNLETVGLEEKELIKIKLERVKQILVFLQEDIDKREKDKEDGMFILNLVKQQYSLILEQLAKYN